MRKINSFFNFSFSSPACKRTDFIAGFINGTLMRMEKSHAIYQALLVADQVSTNLVNALSLTCQHGMAMVQ